MKKTVNTPEDESKRISDNDYSVKKSKTSDLIIAISSLVAAILIWAYAVVSSAI